MKNTSIHHKLEEIARKHLGVTSLKNPPRMEEIVTTGMIQVEKALKAAYLAGEKCGYKHGFKDATTACECHDTLAKDGLQEFLEDIREKRKLVDKLSESV